MHDAAPTARSIARRAPWTPIALVAVLVVGTIATLMVRDAATARERSYLMSLARTAVPSIDVTELGQLSGSEEDLGSPVYAGVKDTLRRIREANADVRFAYLLGAREASDDKLFFFADSEPAGSPDYSAPGDIYEDTTPEELEGYRESRAFTEGPAEDSWGEWVSAMAPVIDPTTGRTVALLGLDISTEQFNQRVRDAEVLPIALTLSLALIIAAYWLLAARTRTHAGDLMREREISRVVLEDLPIGVVVARYPSGEVVLQNPQAWSLAENADEHAHVADYKFVTSEGQPYPPGEVPLAQTLATGKKMVRDDLFVARPSGNLPMRAVSAPVRDADGTVRYAVMVLQEKKD